MNGGETRECSAAHPSPGSTKSRQPSAEARGAPAFAEARLSRHKPFHSTSNELGALANFCGQGSRVTRRGPRRELLVGSDRRTVLDGADHRRLVHAISVCHGGETLLAAHAIDHALLPPIEHGMRENGEIAEHPNQIYPLKK